MIPFQSLLDGLPEVVNRLRQSTVEVRGHGPGGGSGVVWNSDGLIVTNAHVVAHVVRGEHATVVSSDGRRWTAQITSRDPRRDLAALRVSADDLPAAEIGRTDSLRVGDVVLAVGNPMGVNGAVTAGIVHSIGGSGDYLQADVRLAPGNSGGMLADVRGRVLGINTMTYGGIGLAIPSETVTEFLEGGSSRATLGVTLRPVTAENRPGLLILEVTKGGSAQTAGLQLGDVMLTTMPELARTLRAGRILGIDYLRAGQLRHCQVDLRMAGARAA